MRKKLLLAGLIALLTAGFLFMLPGIVKSLYVDGSGHAYGAELARSGLTLEESRASGTSHLQVEAALRAGSVYAALAVVGFFIPLFVIVILLLLHALSMTSTKLTLWCAVVLACGGIAVFTLARIQHGDDASSAVVSSVGLWVLTVVILYLFSALLRALLALVRATRRFLTRKAA